jgi:hypothetical protein
MRLETGGKGAAGLENTNISEEFIGKIQILY